MEIRANYYFLHELLELPLLLIKIWKIHRWCELVVFAQSLELNVANHLRAFDCEVFTSVNNVIPQFM